MEFSNFPVRLPRPNPITLPVSLSIRMRKWRHSLMGFLFLGCCNSYGLICFQTASDRLVPSEKGYTCSNPAFGLITEIKMQSSLPLLRAPWIWWLPTITLSPARMMRPLCASSTSAASPCNTIQMSVRADDGGRAAWFVVESAKAPCCHARLDAARCARLRWGFVVKNR